MKPWINYHHLYYFMTIAESGSISRAAEKLLLGQPTLSAQLKQFEDQIGVKLFSREHKRLVLTEHGTLALDYARNIFKMGGEMYEALHDRLRPNKISLQLGALDSVPKQIMLELTQAALTSSPCTISLVEGKFDELLRDLISNKIDIAISNFLPSNEGTRGLHHRVISKTSLSIFGSKKFRKLRNDFPHSLQGQPFVLPTYDSQVRYNLEHWMRSNELNVEVIAETQDTALQQLIAVNDMALIPAAPHTVKPYLDSGELFEIGKLGTVFEELYLISAQRKISNPVASHLMKTFSL